MKKALFLLVGVLALIGCKETDVYDASAVESLENKAIQENASQIFGTIDPNQDWNTITTYSITVTADADLQNIAKVQILTESPFLNKVATVLNEAPASQGQTVTLTYDVPNIYTTLVAACVNSEGNYYIQAFKVGASEVSFQKAAASRGARRAAASSYNFPAASNFDLPFSKSYSSYNAGRAIRAAVGDYTYEYVSLWDGSGWENERMWRNNSTYDTSKAEYKKTYSGSDWYMQNFSIRRDIENDMTEDEVNNLQAIFNSVLYWKNDKANRQKDNLEIIRNSKVVKLYNNNMIANGDPVILTPVQSTSDEMKYCDLYYYYYNPNEVAGMTNEEQVQYMKDLPKFMAMSCGDAMLTTSGSAEFYKKNQYVLPYYGEASAFRGTTMDGFTTDGKVYRIRNGMQGYGEDFYMTYSALTDSFLTTRIDDNDKTVTHQLWQIFKNSAGTTYLYNIGRHNFLYNNSNGWRVSFSSSSYVASGVVPYEMVEADNGSIHFMGTLYNQKRKGQMLGSDLNRSGHEYNTGLWADKNSSDGTCDWYLEEYTGSKTLSLLDEIRSQDDSNCAQSFVIPKGYYIGFVLKKAMNNHTDIYDNFKNKTHNLEGNGEVYSDGRLNKQINHFPEHFSRSSTEYTMEDNDPRAAIFSANNKTYLTLEDGCDCNYVDMIIEMTDGVEVIDETPNLEPVNYMLCFEDRPTIADYDLNDVVLRASRKNATTLSLTLLATGADDKVVIRGAENWAYNNMEVHEIFGHTEADANGHTFINTFINGTTLTPKTAEVTIDANLSTADYLRGVYIENQTTGRTIRVAQMGEPPFGIMIPEDFLYPLEKISIITAYPNFVNWAQDMNNDQDWYRHREENRVYPSIVETTE